jgi:hypothetical protein
MSLSCTGKARLQHSDEGVWRNEGKSLCSNVYKFCANFEEKKKFAKTPKENGESGETKYEK